MKLYKYIISAVIGLLFLPACEMSFDAVPLSTETREATISIADLKTQFDKAPGLFTINPIESDRDLIIKGRVISSDTAGNIYKFIVIEDMETLQAIKIGIDAGSLSGVYPMGQVLSFKCNGFILGRYAEGLQLGVASYRADKSRDEPGRIPYALAKLAILAEGLPNPAEVVPYEMTIDEILKSDLSIVSRLIRIKNVTFTGKNGDNQTLNKTVMGNDLDPIFAPSTFNGVYNVGYPQARQISDGTGTMNISTSEYARFAKVLLPTGTGDVVAIVGWYKDKDTRPGEWQLTIRSLSDLSGGFVFQKK